MADKIWDEESKTRLATMRAAGWSIRRIGKAFGVTRNAILGIVHRLRCAGDPRFAAAERRPSRTPEEAAEARRAKDAAKRERSDATAARRASRAGRRTPPRPRVDLGQDPGLELSLWDVGPRQCRHVGAGGYCAQPCGSASYCAHHRAIVYRPSAPVRDAGYRGATL